MAFPSDAKRSIGRAGLRLGALFIAAWFLFFAGKGIAAYFGADDLANLHYYWSRPAYTLLTDNLCYWSSTYRPLAALFYVPVYAVFGFHPLPFHLICFTLLALNLVLLYRFCRLLSDSREVGLLATLLASYHARFVDLYYSSGSIYDLACFTFYFAAFIAYIRIRGAGRLPSLRQSLLIAGLYICALNAKEMAVTLPLFLAIYECIYHRPRMTVRELLRWPWHAGRTTLVTGLATLAYVIGKLTGPDSLAQNPAYRLAPSPVRFLHTFHLYLNALLYQDHVFRSPNTVRLLLAMLLVAALFRSRPLLFAWCFLLLSLLPVAFIAHYTACFLYIPSVGWALYGAGILVALRRLLARSFVRHFPRSEAATQAALFLGAACFLAPQHLRQRPRALQAFLDFQPPVREMASELLRVQPRLIHGVRILLVDDPFPRNEYFPEQLARLLYRDMSIRVSRTSVQGQTPADYQNYDLVLLVCGPTPARRLTLAVLPPAGS